MNDTDTTPQQAFEEFYMNTMQLRANIVDANVLICEVARAAGKTEGVMTPRIIRVADSMPGELGFLVHKTYTALMTNVWPNIQATFSRPLANGRPMLEYGTDYVVGETRLPGHFRRPRYPIAYPKHSIVFRNGFHLQLVSSDQPESVAGRSGVHAFIEEMKHNRGEKLKSRLFPSLRGSPAAIRVTPYYQGITGVSDTARVDLGEDAWYEEYEQHVNQELIDEIATVALHVNAAQYDYHRISQLFRQEKNPVAVEKLRLEQEKARRQITLWQPRLDDMRRNATYYIRASSFVNKDILGPKFFKTQLESLDMNEFLTAIGAVRRREVVERFFAYYRPKVHQYSDSYRYESILSMDLREAFRLTAGYLKHYNPHEELIIGYDPGNFSSMIVLQESTSENLCRAIKEFYCWTPKEQPELARQFYDFFGPAARNKHILLYHDRAANKRREEREQISTDARILKRELESYGFDVELMDEGRETIYHWQQFKLLQILFSGRSHAVPGILIDENECPNLCSAIMLSPLKRSEGRIELDKSSERKIPYNRQAGLSTQLPSALIYALYGRYADKISSDLNTIPDDLPDNLLF